MKVVRTIALIIAAIFITVFLYSFFLPSDYIVTRKIIINSKKEIIFQYINNLHSWENWSSWSVRQDSTLKFSYKGPESGIGATQLWNSKRMGKGSIKITKSISAYLIEYLMKMDDGNFISRGKFILKQSETGSELKWIIIGKVSWNPIAKIFSYYYMDSFMGPDLERALRNLKEFVESRKSIAESRSSELTFNE
ncbi:MAG: hypothetical protein EPN82_04265 [Bacteroidetes bacterium]|nr:MAG: hypothetical protein EPN82_04265 [Bacteroidota bacterium]